MTIYNTKIGYTIFILIFILIGGTAIIMAFNKIWLLFLLLVLVLILISYLLLTTSYIIIEKILKVKYSFLFEKSIDITTIKSISETNNPMASPAASLDRLEIRFKNDSIIVSPKNKSGFINHLLEINPAIEIKLKNNSMVKLSH